MTEKETPAFRQWKRHPVPQRLSLPQHLTVSAVVLFNKNVLLINHKRIGAWLPPGGHVEEFELPHEAVVREVFEETGVRVDVLSPNLPDTSDAEAFLLPSPLCMHVVHAAEAAGSVYHLDIVYLCSPIETGASSLPLLTENAEVHAAAWVPLDKLNNYLLAKNVLEVISLAI